MSTSLILIIISSALINNVLLSRFWGVCSFLGVSKQMKASASLGVAVIFVMTIASAVASLLNDYILKPLGLEAAMQLIVFILVIAALVQIVEMFLKKTSPAIYKALGIYLPLITTNCAVLGIAQLNASSGYTFLQSVASGFGSAVGYTLAIVLLAGIRSRIREEDLPAPLHRVHGLLQTVVLREVKRYVYSHCDGHDRSHRHHRGRRAGLYGQEVLCARGRAGSGGPGVPARQQLRRLRLCGL